MRSTQGEWWLEAWQSSGGGVLRTEVIEVGENRGHPVTTTEARKSQSGGRGGAEAACAEGRQSHENGVRRCERSGEK